MKKQTEDVINAYFAGENKYIGVSDLKFEGTYFLYAKDENGWNWDGNNQIYIIYSGKVKSVEDKKAFEEPLFISLLDLQTLCNMLTEHRMLT